MTNSVTIGVLTLNLPDHIHADILTGRDVVSGEMLAYPVIWADRTERNCPRCDQPIETKVPCPVTLDTGAGQGGRIVDLNQQHGCGEWLGVHDMTFQEDATAGDIEAEARVIADIRAKEIDSARDEVTAQLQIDLRDALKRLAELLEDGETHEAAGDWITTGSDTEPGVYHDGTQWIAWDYDPDPDGGPDDVIIVTAKDLEG